jgi:hypothetical protein
LNTIGEVKIPPADHTARQKKDGSESASGKGRVEDQKIRTLEHHKGARTENSKSPKTWPPAN